jgi:F-type H+-transporting ATPase subunit alpha
LPLSRFLFSKSVRVCIRGKINDALHTGLRVVDTILSIGKGQRSLIIGDRVSGKSTIFLNSLLTNNSSNLLFTSKRIYGIYCSINQSYSRVYRIKSLFYSANMRWFSVIIATHSTSPSMLSFIAPSCGTSLCEFLMNNGYDVLLSCDDFSRHSKV